MSIDAYQPKSLQRISVQPNSSILVEPGAMKAHCDVTMTTSVRNAFSNLWAGEGIARNKFAASNKEGWVALESQVPGQIIQHTLQPQEKLTFTRGAVIASDPNVELSVSTQGVSGLLSSVGFFTTTAKVQDGKEGRIFLKSQEGPIQKIEVSPDSPVVVDNKHIIGYSEGLKSEIMFPKNVSSLALGGEGITVRLTGKGTVYTGNNEVNLQKIERSATAVKTACYALVTLMVASYFVTGNILTLHTSDFGSFMLGNLPR